MAVVLHHDYTIDSTPVYDDNSGKWKISASITGRKMELLVEPVFSPALQSYLSLRRRRASGVGSRKKLGGERL